MFTLWGSKIKSQTKAQPRLTETQRRLRNRYLRNLTKAHVTSRNERSNQQNQTHSTGTRQSMRFNLLITMM